MRNTTVITPPRVPLIDERTGLISREWYRFFLNLYTLVNADGNQISIQDILIGPSSTSVSDFVATIEPQLQALAAQIADQSNILSLLKDIQALSVAPSDVAETKPFMSAIQALESAPVYTPHVDDKRYGSFYDVNDQTAAAVNTAYAMSFSNTQYTRGVTLGSPSSRIYVDRPTIYNIQFSAQLDKTSASLGNVWIWLDLNGSTVADTATQVSLQGSNAAVVAAWNFLLEMNAGDYFRLMWATDDTNCYIKHDAAVSPVPVIPSIILTVTDNIK